MSRHVASDGRARAPRAGVAVERPRDYRILVVDDDEAIHAAFRHIFPERRTEGDVLAGLEASLFETGPPIERPGFVLDCAFEGRQALAMVEQARAAGSPYALVFMDFRMPGWDGVETTVRVTEADSDVHVVLCTAQSEIGWQNRVEALPAHGRVLILKKPFDTVEVRQLANTLGEKWFLARRDQARMQALERSVQEQQGELDVATAHLRNEIEGRSLAEGRLRIAQRLEGLGHLAGGICHEINNPLCFIVSSVELMEEGLEDVSTSISTHQFDELSALTRSISTGAHRIARIVQSVKLFARGSDAPVELVDLGRIARAVATRMRAVVPAEIELVVEPSAARAAMGRPHEIEQVLVNLIDNAAHAVADRRTPSPRITISVREGQGSVRLAVSDTGPGIDETVIDRIFDPFFTTKPVDKGTGLGLSICHTLILSAGGTIDVRNDTPRGATFTVSLPVAPAEALPRRAEPAAAASRPLPGAGRILVVDDEPFMLDVMSRLLKGYDVTTTSDPRRGLELCTTESFELILCDIMMPVIDGSDFHRMLSQLDPGMEARIVFITGGALIERVREFIERVPNPCLEKPFDARTLRALVAERLPAGSPSPGEP
jgi:two-component system NtrC family sensor kinase